MDDHRMNADEWKTYCRDHPEFSYTDRERVGKSLSANLDPNEIHHDPEAARALLKNARQLTEEAAPLIDQTAVIVPGVQTYGGFAHHLQPGQSVISSNVMFTSFVMAGHNPHPLYYRTDREIPFAQFEGAKEYSITVVGRPRYYGLDHPQNGEAYEKWEDGYTDRCARAGIGDGWRDLRDATARQNEKICRSEGLHEVKQTGNYVVTTDGPVNLIRARMDGELIAERFNLADLIERPVGARLGKGDETRVVSLERYGRKISGKYLMKRNIRYGVDGGRKLGEKELNGVVAQFDFTLTPEMLLAFADSVDMSAQYREPWLEKAHPMALATSCVLPFFQYGTEKIPQQPIGFTKKEILAQMKVRRGEFLKPQFAFAGLSMIANTEIDVAPQDLSVVVAVDDARVVARRGSINDDGVELKPYLHLEDMTLLFCALDAEKQPVIGGKAYISRTWPVKVEVQ